MSDEILKKAYQKIKGAHHILFVTHDRPDGDALAATCSMIEIAEQLGVAYTAFCHTLPPEQYGFLPHIEKVISDRGELNFDACDLIVVLDCGQMNRTKLDELIKQKKDSQFIIEFDHHPKIDDYADIEIRQPDKSSTAEVIYYFLKANQIKINRPLANCILVGILTDTGNLLYEITTDKTIKIASEMLLYGASFPRILENTWRNKSLGAMQVWGQAMRSLKINKKYNFAYTILTREEMDKHQVSDEELEGFPGYLSNLAGIKGLLFLRELDNGRIKGSLRTAHPTTDVSRLAKLLGGGGHPRASAFVLDGKLVKTNNGWKID